MENYAKAPYKIGIRLEDKYFESRSPITPSDVYDLLHHQHKGMLEIYVEESRPEELKVTYLDEGKEHKLYLKTRCFPDSDYKEAGAILVDSKRFSSICDAILGIKEIPHKDYLNSNGDLILRNGFQENKTYAFFSHTFKSQDYNEDMFIEMINKNCTLIDYEMIRENVSEFKFNNARNNIIAPSSNSKFERTVYFGKYAGIVGAINSLSLLGERLNCEHIVTPFIKLKRAHTYKSNFSDKDIHIADHHRGIHDYDDIEKDLLQIKEDLKHFVSPENCPPFIIGITGKSKSKSEEKHSIVLGNSAIGAKEVIDILGAEPLELSELMSKSFVPIGNKVYVVIFDRDNTTESQFENYLPKLTVLLNCMTWNLDKKIESNGRIITRNLLRKLYANNLQNWHRIIGDVSCDPGGSVEVSVDVYSDNPSYVYQPLNDNDLSLKWSNDDNLADNNRDILYGDSDICNKDGVFGHGTVIYSVTNMPCELPKEASRGFSYMLKDFVLDIAKVQSGPNSFNEFYERYHVARPIKRAVMIYKGKVSPDYSYLVSNGKYRKLKALHEERPCVWSK